LTKDSNFRLNIDAGQLLLLGLIACFVFINSQVLVIFQFYNPSFEHIQDSFTSFISLKIFLMGFLYYILIGAAAGWLGGQFMKGTGFGLLGNIVVGIVGGILGGFLFGMLGLSSDGSMIGSLVTATVGAIVLLYLARLVKK
jgi:uncharacterized membrane protein YeaQ/YmgE (transglycosylase-associated protein family)